MNEIIKGQLVTISPATSADRRAVYDWLVNSDLTPLMLGEPNYPDHPIPTWEEFINDYTDYFFDGSQPQLGRCFIIEAEGKPVGQINHDIIRSHDHSTELDIWLSNTRYANKGYGTDALLTLCNYLNKKFKCRKFIIAPSARNVGAIKSYRKAGFMEAGEIPFDFRPDYKDTVVMEKVLK